MLISRTFAPIIAAGFAVALSGCDAARVPQLMGEMAAPNSSASDPDDQEQSDGSD